MIILSIIEDHFVLVRMLSRYVQEDHIMNQQAIISCLTHKELLSYAIHDDLVVMLGFDGMTYNSIMCYLREANVPLQILHLLSLESQEILMMPTEIF